MGSTASQLRASAALRHLINEERKNPELERFFESTFLGPHKLVASGQLFPARLRPREKVSYHDRWARPTLYMPFLESAGPIYPTSGAPEPPPGEEGPEQGASASSGRESAQASSPIAQAAKVLRQNYELIRQDYESLDSWYRDRNTDTVTTRGAWEKVPVRSYRRWHGEAAWTNTHRILREQLPEGVMACGLGSTYFSRIEGTTYIKEHFGPTNGRIRLHLGLEVPRQDLHHSTVNDDASSRGQAAQDTPEDMGLDFAPALPNLAKNCYLRVADGRYHWEEGQVLAFDDSFYHSVHLEALGAPDEAPQASGAGTSPRRGILLCDVYHPGLTSAEKQFLEKMEHVKTQCFPQLQDWRRVH